MTQENLTLKAVNTIRCLSADVVQGAKSGHPGAPMGCAPMAHSLFKNHMRFDPKDPEWKGRDRFVLSNGHASALIYTMLHLSGYDVTMDDLKSFRQLNSKCAGHPESFEVPGVEVTTGPLGQGIANAVGLAAAEAHMAARYNKDGFNLFNNYTYVIHGDGCLEEGISYEACSLAGTWKLGRLIMMYDDNEITIDGKTSVSFTEDVQKRFEACGWQVLVVDGADTDFDAIDRALEAAKADTTRPSIICCRTTIGYGAAKQGTPGVHGAPLGDEDISRVKGEFGLPDEKYHVPEEVRALYSSCVSEGAKNHGVWDDLFAQYAEQYPTEAAEIEKRFKNELTAEEYIALAGDMFKPTDAAVATRKASHMVLNSIVPQEPAMMGGSADLTHSNLTDVKGEVMFSAEHPEGRDVRFGVREHAMAGICNGLHAYGGIIPYCATFVVFAGYALGSMRVAALTGHQVLYTFTHDSYALGEDGPTHQPVETLATLRALPNMDVWRPCDGAETVGAYAAALGRKNGPSFFAFTRQNLPQLEGSSASAATKGGYVVVEEDSSKPLDAVLVATGSEVPLAIESAKKATGNFRVVSMPCVEAFERQEIAYQESVLPRRSTTVPILSLEAAIATGWTGVYSHAHVGMTGFGASAPAAQLAVKFGFTVEAVVPKLERLAQMKDVPRLCIDL